MLEARSIREGWPPVDLGDILNLRQLRPSFQSWQGLEFEASVAGINRAAGEGLLRGDGLMGYQESMVFNVVWRVQDRIFNEWRRSTELADLYLNASSILQDGPPTKRRRTAIDSWLFPQSEDVSVHAPAPTKDDLDPEWVDESLNEEQRVRPLSLSLSRLLVYDDVLTLRPPCRTPSARSSGASSAARSSCTDLPAQARPRRSSSRSSRSSSVRPFSLFCSAVGS